jgi:hypothetical protein
MNKRWAVAVTTVWLGIGVVLVQAQDRATVQLRDGSRVEGRIEEMTPSTLFVRVSMDDQRKIPIASIALIDRVGGASGLPATEVREAVGSQHLLLLSNGSSLKGQIVAIRGGEGSADPAAPRSYVFRSADGREQTFPPDQVSRVYFGTYPFAAITGTPAPTSPGSDLATGDVPPGALRVPATAGWISTGMRVRRGETISFTTSGQVQLSDNANDRARAAGTPRESPRSPLPTVNAGALIGRVGNSQPFGIGDQASVPMPADGILYLAVNDDERGDNAGEFVVSLSRNRR